MTLNGMKNSSLSITNLPEQNLERQAHFLRVRTKPCQIKGLPNNINRNFLKILCYKLGKQYKTKTVKEKLNSKFMKYKKVQMK